MIDGIIKTVGKMVTDRMPSSRAGLLERLRLARLNTDWRRDSPHPSLEAFRAELAHEEQAGRLTSNEQLEAQALIHRLELDPFATLRSLVDLHEADGSRTKQALRLLQELTVHWGDAMAAKRAVMDLGMLRAQQHAATELLRQFAGKHETVAQIQSIMLAQLRHAAGVSATLDYIEKIAAPLPEILTTYSDLAIDHLIRNPLEKNLRRIFAKSLPFDIEPSFQVSRFYFHRAVVAAVLQWNCDFSPAFGDDALRQALSELPEVPDPAAELDLILRMLTSAPLDQQAQWLISTCVCPPLWRSPLPALEAVRVKLVNALMTLIPGIKTPRLLNQLLVRLTESMPQTIAYWSNPKLPQQLLKMVMEQAGRLPNAQQRYYIGLAAFAVPDLDRVAQEYTLATAKSPMETRYTSYLDPRRVVPASNPEILNTATFQFDFQETTADDGSCVVATSSDDRYFHRHALEYAQSLQVSGSVSPVHFHVIGDIGGLQEDIRRVREALPERRVTFSTETALEKRSFYYASARFLRTAQWLRRFNRTVVVTDIDMTWRVAPEAVINALPDADVGLRIFDCVRYYVMDRTGEVILRYPRLKLWECTSANLYFMRPSMAGHRFADLLADISSQHLKPFLSKPGSHWFIDQNILSALYAYSLRAEPSIRIANLDALGTPFAPYRMLHDERLQQSYGRHWITDPSIVPLKQTSRR